MLLGKRAGQGKGSAKTGRHDTTREKKKKAVEREGCDAQADIDREHEGQTRFLVACGGRIADTSFLARPFDFSFSSLLSSGLGRDNVIVGGY